MENNNNRQNTFICWHPLKSETPKQR